MSSQGGWRYDRPARVGHHGKQVQGRDMQHQDAGRDKEGSADAKHVNGLRITSLGGRRNAECADQKTPGCRPATGNQSAAHGRVVWAWPSFALHLVRRKTVAGVVAVEIENHPRIDADRHQLGRVFSGEMTRRPAAGTSTPGRGNSDVGQAHDHSPAPVVNSHKPLAELQQKAPIRNRKAPNSRRTAWRSGT